MKSLYHWPEVQLRDHATLLPGFAFKSKYFTDNPDDIALVKGANVHQGYIDWEKAKRWPASEFQSHSKFHLEVGDVVVAMDRPWIPAGLKYAWIRPTDPKALLVQRVARLRGSAQLRTSYLRYLIGSPDFEDYIRPIVTGVNVPHISGKQILDFEFRLPPIGIQRKIASILSAYDDLFENNLRRIKILEEMAQNLYREWFVKFRFPGHEKVKFVDSPLGMIPEGWEVTTLGSVIDIKKGKNITKNTAIDGSVPVVGGGLQPSYFHNQPNVEGPVITISASGANAGFVNIYHQDIWASDCSYISIHNGVMYYYYLLLAHRQDDIFHMQHGSAQPHVYPRDLQRLEILSPSSLIIEQFESYSSTLFSLINALLNSNNLLKQTRDLLLPRLISGELDVSDLDIEIPEDMK